MKDTDGGRHPCRSDPGKGSGEQVGKADPRGLQEFWQRIWRLLELKWAKERVPHSPAVGSALGPLPAALSP